MSIRSRTATLAAAVWVVMLSVSASAVSDADKCAAAKHKAAGKYALCRQQVEAKAVKTGAAPDYTNCNATFASKWNQAEAAGHGACPSIDDAAAILAFISDATEAIADALAGDALPPSALACNADLTTCNGNLTGCTGGLNTCSSNLTLCTSTLTGTQGSLSTCNGSLASCNSGLTTCTSTLSGCNTDLASTQGSLGTCTANLNSCGGNLTSCNGGLATCTSNLSGCNAVLTSTQGSLATCNADLSTCDGNLSTCSAGLTTCTTDLGTCNSTLASAQASLSACDTSLDGALACGNGVVEGDEECDQGDLDGETCVTQGFAGGTLLCGNACALDTSGCWNVRYVDNADGTITDHQTGLMWEKKVGFDWSFDFDNPHDVDNFYVWAGLCSVNTSKYCQPTGAAAALCAASADNGNVGCDQCVGDDGDCSALVTIWTVAADANTSTFAGHGDWRVPSRDELLSIVDYTDPTFNPVVDVAFNGAACGPDCTDLANPACSCTQAAADSHWSASSLAPIPGAGWTVDFYTGVIAYRDKWFSNLYLRLVRNAS